MITYARIYRCYKKHEERPDLVRDAMLNIFKRNSIAGFKAIVVYSLAYADTRVECGRNWRRLMLKVFIEKEAFSTAKPSFMRDRRRNYLEKLKRLTIVERLEHLDLIEWAPTFKYEKIVESIIDR